MNKQILMTIAAVVIAATTIFAGCKKDKKDEPIVEKVKVTGVTVLPTAIMPFINSSEPFCVLITPDNADDRSVTWTSDKPGIASVNEDGTLTSHALGEATITCTTNDGGFTASTIVIVKPVRNAEDYATLIPSFYFGDLIMGEETVGTNKLITVKYNSENKIQLSIDEKFKVPQMGNTEVPMKVDCIANVTKDENGYNAVGETTADLMGLSLPVKIEAVFSDSQIVNMNIYVGNIPVMGNITLDFKGVGFYVIDGCATID